MSVPKALRRIGRVAPGCAPNSPHSGHCAHWSMKQREVRIEPFRMAALVSIFLRQDLGAGEGCAQHRHYFHIQKGKMCIPLDVKSQNWHGPRPLPASPHPQKAPPPNSEACIFPA